MSFLAACGRTDLQFVLIQVGTDAGQDATAAPDAGHDAGDAGFPLDEGGAGDAGDAGDAAPVVLVSVTVTPTNPFAPILTTLNFTAIGTYSDGSTAVLAPSSVGWSSGFTTVAMISAAGVATAISIGKTTISATIDGLTGSTLLTVTPALVSIEITEDVELTVDDITVSAVGTFSDGLTHDITTSVVWASSNPLSVSVSPATGLQAGEELIHGLAPGVATISATLGSISSTFVVRVTSLLPP